MGATEDAAEQAKAIAAKGYVVLVAISMVRASAQPAVMKPAQ
nr:hypothetical protein [Pantoea rwandensis]